MTATISPGPLSSRAIRAGGMTPMMKPMLGMKLVTNASTAHTNAPGTPMSCRASPSITATMKPKLAETPM